MKPRGLRRWGSRTGIPGQRSRASRSHRLRVADVASLPPLAGNGAKTSVRIAILGDWGSDLYGARPAAYSIADDGAYDLLIHVGDVYYAGTQREIDEKFIPGWKTMAAGNPAAIG